MESGPARAVCPDCGHTYALVDVDGRPVPLTPQLRELLLDTGCPECWAGLDVLLPSESPEGRLRP